MNKSLGQIAYEAYYEKLATEPELLDDDPAFEKMSDEMKAAWDAAADAVTAALLGEAKLPSARVG